MSWTKTNLYRDLYKRHAPLHFSCMIALMVFIIKDSVLVGVLCLVMTFYLYCSSSAWSSNVRCIGRERDALLQFKQGLVDVRVQCSCIKTWQLARDNPSTHISFQVHNQNILQPDSTCIKIEFTSYNRVSE